MTPNVITIDFETMPIQSRPDYPPEPVGVAIRYGVENSRYYSWGHPIKNNCTFGEGVAALRSAWDLPAGKLFHNAKFDVAVACEKLGLPYPAWDEVEDTMFLSFLADPHNRSGGLKELAADLLDWPPDEQDELKDWVLSRKKRLLEEHPEFRKINKKTGKPVNNIAERDAGAWIFAAPGDLVGKYACGDVDRTYALFQHLYPLIVENGMLEAYNRERQLLPILMENERVGLRVDVEGLAQDIERYVSCRDTADTWLREELGAPTLNIDSDREWAEALSTSGVVDDDQWTLTPSGQRSVSKDNLRSDMYNDPRVASAYGYRGRLGTCLNMFMKPWLRQAEARGGVISTNWHQTRGGDYGGTRTGRPSTSNPNFLNLSKNFEGRTDGYVHPDHFEVAPLPLVRRYILPDEGHLWLHRDFDSQELRIFAHFESGDLFSKYLASPDVDVHTLIRDRVTELTGTEFERTIVKNINFGKLYGAGIPRIAELIQGTRAEAQELKSYHEQAMPGAVVLNEEIKRIVRAGEPIRTWGGRCYFPEPPKDGRNFEYKLLNYLVQGSAADITKQALIDWHTHPDRDPACRFMVTVYDEINLSAPEETWREQMAVLREVMERNWLDIPMLSSPKVGSSWGDCRKVEE